MVVKLFTLKFKLNIKLWDLKFNKLTVRLLFLLFIDTKGIKHNLEDFEKVREEIKEINPENLTIIMESTGIYCF